MQKKKILVQAAAVLSATALSASPVLAAGWQKDATGWWWQEDNGSYPVSQWKWLDGNKDGIYECYAFDSNGYMYADTTTPDGYTVNKEGAWTIGNSVQLKFAKDMQNESGSNDNTAADNSTSDNTVYTNEDMVGTFRINDENREDYFELMLGAGDSIAAFYYDTDGDTHIYSFSKVSNTKYRDSSNSRNLTIVDYDTIIVNDRTYIRD